MAKKPSLSISGGLSDNDSKFKDYMRGYRMSNNVEDRRGASFRPTETPQDVEYSSLGGDLGNMRRISIGAGTGYVREGTQTTDDYSDDMQAYGGNKPSTTTPTSTRKVSPEEAIQRTHRDRK